MPHIAEHRPQRPFTAPERYRYWTDERLRFGDLDSLGHANNNAIGVYFESARVALFEEALGGPLGTLKKLSVVLARMTIDFIAELHYPAPHLRVGTRVSRIGRSSVTLEAAVYKGDLCVSTSEAVCVLFDPVNRRSAPVPDAVRAHLLELAGTIDPDSAAS